MRKFSTVIIGGGASGIVAAIGAARKGADVMICEKTPRPGKKILASGNGRCNLANEDLDIKFYNPASRTLVRSVFSRFGLDAIKGFFEDIGLRLYSEGGRIFPATDQSSSVLKVLEMELRRLSVAIETGFDVTSVTESPGGGFTVSARSGGSVSAGKVVLACGGKSYPAFGSDGNACKIAERMGHTIIEPVPVAVPVLVKDPLCHLLQGQKIKAVVRSVVNGKERESSSGDLLFAKYGLSGTAILDASQSVSIAINRDRIRGVSVVVDMVPFMGEAALSAELAKRAERKVSPDEMTAGILPNKFGVALRDMFRTNTPSGSARLLKNKTFKVLGTRGWNEADFTAGGIDTNEVDANSMESRLRRGVYFAGEMLDVNGARGGYNLAWAWASGFVAGEAAADG
jgi:predicted Rossmann fold flavoprotein